jgi:hypothetical protein
VLWLAPLTGAGNVDALKVASDPVDGFVIVSGVADSSRAALGAGAERVTDLPGLPRGAARVLLGALTPDGAPAWAAFAGAGIGFGLALDPLLGAAGCLVSAGSLHSKPAAFAAPAGGPQALLEGFGDSGTDAFVVRFGGPMPPPSADYEATAPSDDLVTGLLSPPPPTAAAAAAAAGDKGGSASGGGGGAGMAAAGGGAVAGVGLCIAAGWFVLRRRRAAKTEAGTQRLVGAGAAAVDWGEQEAPLPPARTRLAQLHDLAASARSPSPQRGTTRMTALQAMAARPPSPRPQRPPSAALSSSSRPLPSLVLPRPLLGMQLSSSRPTSPTLSDTLSPRGAAAGAMRPASPGWAPMYSPRAQDEQPQPQWQPQRPASPAFVRPPSRAPSPGLAPQRPLSPGFVQRPARPPSPGMAPVQQRPLSPAAALEMRDMRGLQRPPSPGFIRHPSRPPSPGMMAPRHEPQQQQQWSQPQRPPSPRLNEDMRGMHVPQRPPSPAFPPGISPLYETHPQQRPASPHMASQELWQLPLHAPQRPPSPGFVRPPSRPPSPGLAPAALPMHEPLQRRPASPGPPAALLRREMQWPSRPPSPGLLRPPSPGIRRPEEWPQPQLRPPSPSHAAPPPGAAFAPQRPQSPRSSSSGAGGGIRLNAASRALSLRAGAPVGEVAAPDATPPAMTSFAARRAAMLQELARLDPAASRALPPPPPPLQQQQQQPPQQQVEEEPDGWKLGSNPLWGEDAAGEERHDD